jgi:integrase/recombinase XerD
MKLSAVVSLYVIHKRALGYRFRSDEDTLQSFCRSVDDLPIKKIDPKAVLAFLNGRGRVTDYWSRKYRTLLGMYRFALARGWVTAIPLPSTIPKSTVPCFVPYIYSHDELKRLIAAIPAACGGRASIEADVYKNLLLLLYGAGLRIAEALALTMADINIDEGYLHIRDTKFFKSRLVPMGKHLKGLITEHIAKRCEPYSASTQLPLFCFRDGSPLSQSAVRSAFRRLRRHAGVLREGGTRRQPRIHDLRHTAAVHRVIAWYVSGADLQDLLPKLATYLGHVSLSSTQRYLTMTPELLRQASLCFEKYATGGCK